jgi:hypothetical protein
MTRTAPSPVRIDLSRWPVALWWDLAESIGRTLLGPESASDPVAGVEVRLEPHAKDEGATVEAAVHSRAGRRRVLLRLERVGASWTRDGRFEHVDAPGVLACSQRGGRTVYARCPLLDRLGVPAGSYALRRPDDEPRA